MLIPYLSLCIVNVTTETIISKKPASGWSEKNDDLCFMWIIFRIKNGLICSPAAEPFFMETGPL